MTTMIESAARHLAEGVEDLAALARLVEADTGRVPARGSLSSYRSSFRRHGLNWVEAERARSTENSRRWQSDHSEKYRMSHRENNRRWHAENPAKRLLNQCKQRARKRGLHCTLKVEDVVLLLAPMTCAATGLPLLLTHDGGSKANPWAPSIGRIDCSKGYVPGNIRVVCWAFNQMRGDFPDEVVERLAGAVVRPPLTMAPATRGLDPSLRVNGCVPATHLLGSCRSSARRRRHECTITAELIGEMLAPMTCSATGLPLTWEHDGRSRVNPWVPSVDRINCSLGYVPGNIRIVCWAFNQMRGDFPDEVVLTLAKAIVSRRPAP